MPWFAALILGATAHAGWLVHELRTEPHQQPTAVIVHVDARPATTTPQRVAAKRARERELGRAHRTQRVMQPRCRHAQVDRPASEHASFDLDIWVQRTDRYAYTIDRRALEQVAFGPIDADLRRLGIIAKALASARTDQPIELRNIHAGTPLWLLGLRTGDRLLALATRGEPELERVDLTIERRGRPVALSYALI